MSELCSSLIWVSKPIVLHECDFIFIFVTALITEITLITKISFVTDTAQIAEITIINQIIHITDFSRINSFKTEAVAV